MNREELQNIAAGIAQCKRCPLCKGRTQTVPGHGLHDAKVVFIGEAPGENEDRQGLPFVGRSGTYLKKLLRETGGKPEWCYITNTVKCRPPENRAPEDSESQACWFWLDRQLRIIDPRIIVCVGRVAALKILPIKKTTPMRTLVGKWHTATILGKPIATRVIYHPSYLLQHGRAEEQVTRDDLAEIWRAASEFAGGDA